MGERIIQVDAFTDKPFSGNPAAVCILSEDRGEVWMQSVAREMNLSETAFVIREGDGFRLRWFTPVTEVDLCGHATLATAHVLWEEGVVSQDQVVRFHTRSGLLTAKLEGEWIKMDFPALPVEEIPAPDDLVRALGVQPRYVGQSGFGYLVEVDSQEALESLEPELALLMKLPALGVAVTSRSSSSSFDFVSRFFAPKSGINEDPVTGSAHCSLGPYWGSKLGKDELTAYQASSRGGVIKVHLAGDRVHLGGKAVTVMRGELID